MILLEIYNAITEAPEILTPEFIDALIKNVLPVAESDADDKVVKQAINHLYQDFPEVSVQISNMLRKSFSNAKAEIGDQTAGNTYPDNPGIDRLKASLKSRIQKASTLPPNAKN